MTKLLWFRYFKRLLSQNLYGKLSEADLIYKFTKYGEKQEKQINKRLAKN